MSYLADAPKIPTGNPRGRGGFELDEELFETRKGDGRRNTAPADTGESIEELLSQRDPMLMLNQGARGRSAKSRSLLLSPSGAGGDMLDSLKAAVEMRDAGEYYESDQEDDPDDEELRFQMEFQKELGLSLGDDSGQLSKPPSRKPSPELEDGDDVDIDNLLEDIDDRKPSKPKAKPSSRRPTPPLESEENDQQSEYVPELRHPEPSRARSRTPPPSNAYEDLANEPEPVGTRARSRTPPIAEPTESSRTPPPSRPASQQENQPPSRRGTPPPLDVDHPPSGHNTPAASDAGSTAGTPTQQKPAGDPVVNRRTKMLQLFGSRASLPDSGDVNMMQGKRSSPSSPKAGSDSPPLPEDFVERRVNSKESADSERRVNSKESADSVERRVNSQSPAGNQDLDNLLQPKPKRKLAAPKAKSKTGPDEPPNASPAVETRSSSKRQEQKKELSDLLPDGGSHRNSPPLPPSPPASPKAESESRGDLPMFDDSGGLDDLLGDNSAPSKEAPTQSKAEHKDDSDDGLPDFLNARDQARNVRGEAGPPPKMDPAKRSSLASLGFSDDEGPPESPMDSPADRSMEPPHFQTSATKGPDTSAPKESIPGPNFAPAYSPAGSSTGGINYSPSGTPAGDTHLDDLLAARAKPQGRRLSRAKAKALAAMSPTGTASEQGKMQQTLLAGGTPAMSSASGSTTNPPPGSTLFDGSSAAGDSATERMTSGQQVIAPAGTHHRQQTFSFSDLGQTQHPGLGITSSGSPAFTKPPIATQPDVSATTLDPRTQALLAQALELPRSPGSEPALNLHQAAGAAHAQAVPPFPPMNLAPSSDVLQKLAYSEAKVRQLELQLQEQEQKWQQRLTESKLHFGAEKDRMEHSCRRMEQELDRLKDVHSGDMRHLNENKQMMLQNFELEKDAARRDERRKAETEIERIKKDTTQELEEQRLQHERAIKIVRDHSDLEIESVKKSYVGVAQLDSLMHKVQGSVEEVGKMSKKVESDKMMEHNLRERQLVVREQNVQEMENRLKTQAREVEDQRKKMTELVSRMKESQVDDRTGLALERERLEAEHRRLEELQITLRETDRSNKEQIRHSWNKLEEEKRIFNTERLQFESDMSTRREETEARERRIQHEVDRLKVMHEQVETARANASKRIRESETMIAGERRCLMNDLEVFEEKKRTFAEELEKFEIDRKALNEERKSFDQERHNVGQMAVEVQQRSAEVARVFAEVGDAKEELERLRQQLAGERSMHGQEMERLKTMQTIVEQQRLQLLQTENQIRMQGIEDFNLTVSCRSTFAAAVHNNGSAPMLQNSADLPMPMLQNATPMMQPSPALGGMTNAASAVPLGGTTPADMNSLVIEAAKAAVQPLQNFQPPVRAQALSEFGQGSVSMEDDGSRRARLEMHSRLRQIKDQSTDMHMYLQEQTMFLQGEGVKRAGIATISPSQAT